MLNYLEMQRAMRQGSMPSREEDDMGDGEVATTPIDIPTVDRTDPSLREDTSDAPTLNADPEQMATDVPSRRLDLAGTTLEQGHRFGFHEMSGRPDGVEAAPASAEEVIAKYGSGDDAPTEKRIAPQVMASEPEQPQRDPPPTWITRLGDRMQVAGTANHRKPDFTEADRIDAGYAAQVKSDAQKAADARARKAFPVMAAALGPNAGAAEILAAIKAREPQAQREFQDQQGQLTRENAAEIARQANASRERIAAMRPVSGAGKDGTTSAISALAPNVALRRRADIEKLGNATKPFTDLFTALRQTEDQTNKLGEMPTAGERGAAAIPFLGPAYWTSDKVRDLNQAVNQLKASVALARSGKALNQTEIARLDDLIDKGWFDSPEKIKDAVKVLKKGLHQNLKSFQSAFGETGDPGIDALGTDSLALFERMAPDQVTYRNPYFNDQMQEKPPAADGALPNLGVAPVAAPDAPLREMVPVIGADGVRGKVARDKVEAWLKRNPGAKVL